jgi:hypothetical protein
MRNSLTLSVLLVSLVCETTAQSQVKNTPARAPTPVTMTECEGVNNCATWTFLGAQGNGQWPTGEIANLTVERYDNNSVVIKRADSTGASAGLTGIYTGTRHGDRVGGDFTSSWPGHWNNKAGNWYATLEQGAIARPSVMHFCGANCTTLTLDHGHYIAGPRNSWEPTNFTSTWTIETFTRESVVIHRHDSPNPANAVGINGWDTTYKGKISSEGNSLIFTSQDDRPVSPNLRLTWGSALNSTPGSNAERDAGKVSPPPTTVVVPIVPVVCVPWFFGMVCGG